MASAVPVPRISPEEYLAIERRAAIRSEYHDGEMFAMAGGTRAHGLIGMNVGGELRQRLKSSGCEVYGSDTRVKIPATGLYTYPDVSVVCPPLEFEDQHGDTLLNPVVIVEVLSDSTEAYDRGRKFEHYRKLASLREYLLVSQHEACVEHFTRGADGKWSLYEAAGRDDVVALLSLGCALPLAEVYAKVELPERVPLHGEPGQAPPPPALR